jgi:uncharacterized protein YqjF (DUF2071 family)
VASSSIVHDIDPRNLRMVSGLKGVLDMTRFPREHRPWPLPPRRWTMAMTWYDLAFLHWPVPAEQLRPLIPSGLELDTYDGQAWLGIVPFGMSGVRPRCLPVVPWLSKFLELNVRTYVTAEGKPGVWFCSLDAANPVAVRIARKTFNLPYYDAAMRLHHEPDGWRNYRSRLIERYCLYAADRQGGLYRGEILHAPWPLQCAEVDLIENRMAAPFRIKLPDIVPIAHFNRRIDVRAWSLDRIAGDGSGCTATSAPR